MKQGEKINYFGGLLQSIYQKTPRTKTTTIKKTQTNKKTHTKKPNIIKQITNQTKNLREMRHCKED